MHELHLKMLMAAGQLMKLHHKLFKVHSVNWVRRCKALVGLCDSVVCVLAIYGMHRIKQIVGCIQT